LVPGAATDPDEELDEPEVPVLLAGADSVLDVVDAAADCVLDVDPALDD
jgi:hypothetical protein